MVGYEVSEDVLGTSTTFNLHSKITWAHEMIETKRGVCERQSK